MEYERYFALKGIQRNQVVIHQRLGKVDFRTLSLKRAVQLFNDPNFHFLVLTEAGKAEYGIPRQEAIKLIRNARTKAELNEIRSMTRLTKSIETEIAKRLEKIN